MLVERSSACFLFPQYSNNNQLKKQTSAHGQFVWSLLSCACVELSRSQSLLDENEGSGKDQFLGDPDWLSEM